MKIDVEDRRYSNSTTITSSDADEGFFASVVTVQHNQTSGEQLSSREAEWKKVSWPTPETFPQQHPEVQPHPQVLHSDNYHLQERTESDEKPFRWIHQVADQSHHLVSEAEMELQKRAFDVRHANDRSRSRSRSNYITSRARSFERAQASGTEGPPPPVRRRSPSLRRCDGDWIDSGESLGQRKSRHRWASVGRLDTSSWETRIRQGSPAPPPPQTERHHRRRHLTGEQPLSREEGKDAKVSEWIRKSQDCLVSQGEQTQTDFESSNIESMVQSSTQHYHQESLQQMEEERQRQELEIRRQTEELRRKELEAKKLELDLLRRKEEQQRADLLALSQQKALEEERVRRLKEAEEKRMAEERRIAEEKRLIEERRIVEEKRIIEERRIAEEKRILEERRIAEEKRIAQERKLAEERRIAEEIRIAEEKRIAQEKKIAVERKLAEERRMVEEKRVAQEKKITEERKLAEERRVKEEKRQFEKKRVTEEKRMFEEIRLAEARKLELSRIEESRRYEELQRQRKYEEQLKAKHMEEERRKEQMLLYETRLSRDKEEQERLEMEQRQERLMKQEEERKQVSNQHPAERASEERQSRRPRTRHRSREARFPSQERQEVPRPMTPISVRTGHVNDKRQFFNQRSKSMDRKEEFEPRRQRFTILKDWAHAVPNSADNDPPSRPGSSLGQTLGVVKHSIDSWNHGGSPVRELEPPRPGSRVRSLSHHRDWKPDVSERPCTPTRFDGVETHQVTDTVKEWGPHSVEGQNERTTPVVVPSRVIGETFADSRVEAREWKGHCKQNEGISHEQKEDAPWRMKTSTTPEPNLKLVNISVTRSVTKEKSKETESNIRPGDRQVPSRGLLIEELPDLPLRQEIENCKAEVRMRHMSSTNRTTIEESKDLPVPVVSDSWLSGSQADRGMNVISPTSSVSTIAHLDGLKSPTQTGKTPLPVLAGWYDPSSKKGVPPRGTEVQKASHPPASHSSGPAIQKYESDVDKRARELEELRSMRADRNKRLQDAFELGDPYVESEGSALSYSDGYSEDEESQKQPEVSSGKPAPSRRIGNLFKRSSEQWVEEKGPCPPQRNSSKEFMKALKS